MDSRPTGLTVMIASVVGFVANLLSLLSDAPNGAPLWRDIGHVVLLIATSVLAVLGYRRWKRPPAEQ
jgi:uncharacterized membrane protein YidH (DUF202 family)